MSAHVVSIVAQRRSQPTAATLTTAGTAATKYQPTILQLRKQEPHHGTYQIAVADAATNAAAPASGRNNGASMQSTKWVPNLV